MPRQPNLRSRQIRNDSPVPSVFPVLSAFSEKSVEIGERRNSIQVRHNSELRTENCLQGTSFQFLPNTIEHPIHKMYRLRRRELPRNFQRLIDNDGFRRIRIS